MTRLDPERIRNMAAAGMTTREIASALGCSHSRIGQILAQHGPAPAPTVSIKAYDGRVVIETDSPQIVGVAIRRALDRAGIAVTD